MSKDLKETGGVIDLSPENLKVVNTYLSSGLSIPAVAQEYNIPEQAVLDIVESKACTTYIHKQLDAMMYKKQDAISQTFEMIIKKQLEEAQDTGVLTTKDLVEVLKIYADIQLKIEAARDKRQSNNISASQTNVNIGNDAIESTGMAALMDKMIAAKKSKRAPKDIDGEIIEG